MWGEVVYVVVIDDILRSSPGPALVYAVPSMYTHDFKPHDLQLTSRVFHSWPADG